MPSSGRHGMRSVMLASALLWLSGCLGHIDRTQQQRVQQFSAQQLGERLVPGKTHQREVLLLLGPPSFPHEYNASDLWFYHSKSVGKALYLIVPRDYNREVTLTLTFNPDKTLRSWRYDAQ